MTLVMPIGAAGHTPEEMPGIEKIVIVREGDRWLARVFPDSSKMIASGGGLGPNIAGALYGAIVDHNKRQR